jgi:cytochrome c oxidase subunit 2
VTKACPPRGPGLTRGQRPRRSRRLRLLLLAAALPVALSGCTAAQWSRGGWPAPVTVQGDRVLKLWQGSLIAALCVGGIVIGLILMCAVFYRKRGDSLPRQVRYNLPIEIAYTVVPMIIIGILFYFTAVDENAEDKLTPHPQVVVHVVGFQWSWQFDYVQDNLQITGRPGQIPTLTIPTYKTIRFIETSPDVVHSFWVIPFLFKRDVIPGRTNEFQVTVNRTGYFAGKCTEFCGVDHDRMLFWVHAVTYPQYLAFLKRARVVATTGSNPMFSLISASPSTSGGHPVTTSVSSGSNT